MKSLLSSTTKRRRLCCALLTILVANLFILPTQSFLLPSLHPTQLSTVLSSRADRLQQAATEATQDDTKIDTNAVGVSIEYCTGCRWGLRSFWMAQELLFTFQNDCSSTPLTVTLLPQTLSPGGQFNIKLHGTDCNGHVLWDRSREGGFPEIKQLKQIVRDEINPNKFLGHADSDERRQEQEHNNNLHEETSLTGKDTAKQESNKLWMDDTLPQPHVVIRYCIGCKWLLRAAYYGQELLSTFSSGEIKSLSLQPSTVAGEFTVYLANNGNTELLWDRSSKEGFPSAPELKQLVRDKLVPSKDLGHSDRSN